MVVEDQDVLTGLVWCGVVYCRCVCLSYLALLEQSC